jgi:pimeloyl-ACP methyl ester carboxylesterase
MPWPQPTDYNAAIQNPAVSLADPDLRQGRVVTNPLGLPSLHSGNFADVYQMQGSDGQSWAVKCFTREIPGLAVRYRSVSEHLRRVRRPFLVDFTWLVEGIRIKGQWFPLLKMRWVEGFTLNQFLDEYADHHAAVNQLAGLWLKLARELREALIGHGDLQHGNVLLVPGSQASSMALKLIDYDGLWVPELAGRPSGEVGHPSYQHPQRLREGGYGPEVDRFSVLAIYTALRALTISGKDLWKKYDSGENILFREADFRDPSRSKLFAELMTHSDATVRALTSQLLVALRHPPESTPLLDEIVDRAGARPLTLAEEGRVQTVLLSSPCPPPLPISAVLEPIAPAPTPPPLLLAIMQSVPSRVAEPHRASARRSRFRAVAVALLLGSGFVAAMTVLIAVIAGANPDSGGKGTGGPTEERQPRLHPITGLTLTAGDTREVVVELDRADCRTPLVVGIDQLPPNAQGESVIVPVGESSAVLFVHLDPRTPASKYTAIVTLSSDSHRVDSQPLPLLVERLPLPSMKTPEALTLARGKTRQVELAVDRQDCTLPLTLEIEGLPYEIQTVSPVHCPPMESAFTLSLTPRPDAPPGLHLVTLNLYAGDIKVEQFLWNLSVDRMGDTIMPRTVGMPRIAQVTAELWKQGEVGYVKVVLDRQGYEGEVELEITTPMPRVFASVSVTVPEKQTEFRMPVQVLATALAGGYSLEIVARAGKRTSPPSNFTATVPGARVSLDPPKAGSTTTMTFHTADHVDLVGTLYTGEGKRHDGCILLLHDLGSDRSDPNLVRLAQALQNAGRDVVTFDFRGHGESTKLLPIRSANFWNVSANRTLKSYQPKMAYNRQATTITAADMDPTYHPWLVNDIAAVRMMLDRLHDERKVNTDNLILIGSGESATLGALWVAAEYGRFRQLRANPRTNVSVWNTIPEARQLAGVLWFTPTPTFGKQTIDLDDWLRRTYGKTLAAPPILFVCGERDEAAVSLANERVKKLRLRGTAHKLTEVVTIKDSILAGQNLLQEKETEKLILDRVTKMLESHPVLTREVRLGGVVYGYGTDGRFTTQQTNGVLYSLVPITSFGINWIR